MLNGLGFCILSTGVICAVAVGFASVTTSRPATLTTLIGWQLVASPILANISSLGSARKLILGQAVFHFSPIALGGGHGAEVHMGHRNRTRGDGGLAGGLPRARGVAHPHDGRLTAPSLAYESVDRAGSAR